MAGELRRLGTVAVSKLQHFCELGTKPHQIIASKIYGN